MRKTAGFLIVLFFATLAVVATSTGETSSSHPAHLTAAYGPQLELGLSCDACHETDNYSLPLLSYGQVKEKCLLRCFKLPMVASKSVVYGTYQTFNSEGG